MPDFSRQMAGAANAIINQAHTVLAGEAETTLEDVRRATPVATGRARDGWRLEEGPTRTSENGADLVISNAVPYVSALELGTANQPPVGMLRLGLSAMQVRLNRL